MSTEPVVTNLTINPGTTPELLRTISEGANAVIITSNALGALPTLLHSTVREIVESGVPVVVLPDNPRRDNGVLVFTDPLVIKTRSTGVTYLEKGNDNRFLEVDRALRELISLGLEGVQLAEALQAQFGYGPEEERPSNNLGTRQGLVEIWGEEYVASLYDQDGWPRISDAGMDL